MSKLDSISPRSPATNNRADHFVGIVVRLQTYQHQREKASNRNGTFSQNCAAFAGPKEPANVRRVLFLKLLARLFAQLRRIRWALQQDKEVFRSIRPGLSLRGSRACKAHE